MMTSLLHVLLVGASAAADPGGGAEPVALVRLLVAPQQYREKRLSTSGIARRREDGIWALYLDCESARMEVLMNSVAFHPKEGAAADGRAVEMKYVMVSGLFLGATARHGSYSGVFGGVSEVTPYPLLREVDEDGKPLSVDTAACPE